MPLCGIFLKSLQSWATRVPSSLSWCLQTLERLEESLVPGTPHLARDRAPLTQAKDSMTGAIDAYFYGRCAPSLEMLRAADAGGDDDGVHKLRRDQENHAQPEGEGRANTQDYAQN